LLALLPVSLLCQNAVIIRPELEDAVSHRMGFFPQRLPVRPKVALVLSGGGARGAAQIGVLKAFERHNIPIDFISSTSLGAIIGGLYASGYTTAELETLALTTNWDEVLSLSSETKRTELFVDQKLADDRSFLLVRFEGFEPVIPSAVSTGQRLTNFLSTQTLQSLYHPNPSFDDLKIPFRAVSTDLISGRRIILGEGSLAEALRASATVPLLFSPIERDSMQLVDGGLVSNIPVDIAKEAGYDIIIAVNSTSGLRNADELKAPWQAADQIMGIMMQLPNQMALQQADVVVTPRVGNHLSSDFRGLDTLIAAGERAAEEQMPEILRLIGTTREKAGTGTDDIIVRPMVEFVEGSINDSLAAVIRRDATGGALTLRLIRSHVHAIYERGGFEDVYAEVFRPAVGAANHVSTDSLPTRIVYHARRNPTVTSIRFKGNRLLNEEVLIREVSHLVGAPANHMRLESALENILRRYRAGGYSLARIDSVTFDKATGITGVLINEGVIDHIDVQGGVRTQDSFVLREFPLKEGDVFDIDRATDGIDRINGTTLFEYVYLEVAYAGRKPFLTIRLRERPAQLVRFGLRVDSERNLQGSIDIRDENFRGLGTELGVNIAGGNRNREYALEFKAHRLFDTYLTFNVNAYYRIVDSYIYADAPVSEHNRWDRDQVGEYRDIRYGGRLIFGSQLERFGNATIDLSLQNVRIRNLENADSLNERYRLSMVRLGTVIDSKDAYPFATTGIGMTISYEFAFKGLGSQVGYNALRFMYESYGTWGGRHTIHPKLTVGFADRTMPLGEQFRLGGSELMFGTREDDRRGRQLFLINFEYRYALPFRILFESYLRARYDMGSISVIPEEIKFATLRHGIGAALALDTPIGPASFGIGKSFYFGRDLPDNPVLEGPFLFYFMLGYQLPVW
jgi:NTE family protein